MIRIKSIVKPVPVLLTCTLGLSMLAVSSVAQARLSGLDVLNTLSPSGGVGVTHNLAYGQSPEQQLDVYYPTTLMRSMRSQETVMQAYPMVVFVHGGSWETGSKEDYAFVGQSFAQAGYVTAVIDYRKAPQHVYPDFVKDTAKAIAWTHQNASQLHGNQQALAVVGHSAGAFNAVAAVADPRFLAEYGMTPDQITTVVGIAGPYSYDFRQYESRNAFPEDAHPDQIMPDRNVALPQSQYLLLTAANDRIVDDRNTQRMAAALSEAGVQVRTASIDRASHATSIASFARPLRWLNTSRAQVLEHLEEVFEHTSPQ